MRNVCSASAVRLNPLILTMNKWREFEKKVRPALVVLAFLVAFMAMNRCEAEMRYEIGAGFLSGEYSEGTALIVTETFDNNWSVGMGYISKQEVTDRAGTTYEPRENLWGSVQRSVNWKELEMGLGLAYFNGTNRALGSNFVASMSIHWNITDSFSVGFRHFSNAGSASPNMGQDIISLSWTF